MAPRLGRDKLTIRQRNLVHEIAKGKTLADAARSAGYNGSDTNLRIEAHKTLKKPNVYAALNKALDKMGASVEDSARVIGEAHKAEEIVATKTGGVISLGPDHKTRLKAAELNGRFRKLLSNKDEESGTVMNVGFFIVKGLQERGLNQ